MYEVSIKQEQEHKTYDGKGVYNTSETVVINVKSVEEIETIVGLFASTSTISINKLKEVN